jgi:cytochrome c biogenesis protein ResB
LLKAGKRVGETVLKEGETYQTPWMGMTIFVGSIVAGSEAVLTATAATPEPGVDLPPSAILIRPVGAAEPVWLAQGEAKEIQAGGRRVMAVFGNESLRLPFELKLNKFTRFDYPGTETAMSFESSVRLQRDGTEHRISMNEPLKQDGFTLYQASYQMSPGEPVATILSVNRDPGRAIKYAGSLILAIGIALFTLSRSRLNRDNGRKATATAGASA